MNSKQLAEDITSLIIKELESGNVPWRKPWTAGGFLPTSITTGKPYGGINVLILSIAQARGNYKHPLWVTFNETNRRGGSVIKGSKSVEIVKWGTYDKVIDGETVRRFYLRSHRVFNISQTTLDVPAEYLSEREPVSVPDALAAIIAGYPNKPEIFHRAGDKAYYSPLTDSITIPAMEQYENATDYAYTLCHEVTHSTGHQSRLNRFADEADAPAVFGSPVYAKEELVADIGANILLSSAGVQLDVKNSAAYIKGWLKALNDDSNLIISAATKAQKAADYVLGVKIKEDAIA